MDEQRGDDVSKMNKRLETMEDGRRYIIYYTFGSQDTGGVEGEPGREQAEDV